MLSDWVWVWTMGSCCKAGDGHLSRPGVGASLLLLGATQLNFAPQGRSLRQQRPVQDAVQDPVPAACSLVRPC